MNATNPRGELQPKTGGFYIGQVVRVWPFDQFRAGSIVTVESFKTAIDFTVEVRFKSGVISPYRAWELIPGTSITNTIKIRKSDRFAMMVEALRRTRSK